MDAFVLVCTNKSKKEADTTPESKNQYNAENCCCKNTILVEGKTAQDKCDTCCGSFDEKKGGTFRNLFKTPESRLEVECEATNCVYNTDRRCSAEHIGITGGNATVSMQTECSSFQKR